MPIGLHKRLGLQEELPRKGTMQAGETVQARESRVELVLGGGHLITWVCRIFLPLFQGNVRLQIFHGSCTGCIK